MDSLSILFNDATHSFQASSTIDTLPDELLLTVFSVLSLRDRAKIRTVSKRWNDVVMDLGIHLEPLFVDDQEGIPFYSNDVTIELNLWAWLPKFTFLQQGLEAEIPYANLNHVGSSEPMYWRRSEFVTNPPISTLALQVIGPPGSPRQPMHAVLRVAAPTATGSVGIRLGDLLDAFDSMRAYDTNLSLQGWCFAAWFATTRDGFSYGSVCEGTNTKSRIQVCKCTGNGD